MNIKSCFALSGLVALGSCGGGGYQISSYPEARTVDTVDVYFGTSVADPYRWLENDTSAETAEWVKAQNEISSAYLNAIPFHEKLKERMTKLADYEKFSAPEKHNGKYYFFRNDGLQNQSVLYVCDKIGGEERVVLDPNKLSDNGTVALTAINFSKDGKYLAYTISRNGSDWNEIFVIDLASGNLLDDHIEWAKFTDAQWLGDGFYYSAYDAPKDGKAFSSKNECQKVMFHKLGTPQSQDRVEYVNPKEPLLFYAVQVSDDDRYLFLNEGTGGGNNLYVKDLKAARPEYVAINKDIDAEFFPFQTLNGKIYVRTNSKAPNYRVLAYDANNLGVDNFTVVVPEGKSVIENAQFADGKLIVTRLEDAANHAYVYEPDGKLVREIKFPALGTVGISSDNDEKEVFYTFASFTYPGTVFEYDIASDKSTVFKQPKVDFKADDYVTEQVKYQSKDGTEIPMFIIYKKGLKKDGKNPTLVYGYGGFNVSLTPGFSPYRIPFLEAGGVYAMANLRGGGEYGEEWHVAGTKMNKQNVFDDFIAASEYLIKEGYTSPEHLACQGGSNGGLLIGATVNQRPDLFAAAVPQVGVMDMLRYHTFTIGWNWAHDYGRSDDSKEMFEYLYKYSPLHNIKNDGTKYPAILVTTADHDDRVVPAHSFKYAATLQASNTGDAPKIIRIDSNAGHGAGKPISKIISEQCDIYSFVMYNTGLSY